VHIPEILLYLGATIDPQCREIAMENQNMAILNLIKKAGKLFLSFFLSFFFPSSVFDL